MCSSDLKYSIFQKCYFSERKMFSCVWLHFKKFSEKYFLVFGKEKGKDKPSKTRTKPRKNLEKKSSTIDARLGSTARCFASSSSTTTPRDHELHSNDHNLTKARSRSTSRDRDRRHDLTKRQSRSWIAVVGLELARSAWTGARGSPMIVRLDWSSVINDRALTHSLSLSLSLSPEIL